MWPSLRPFPTLSALGALCRRRHARRRALERLCGIGRHRRAQGPPVLNRLRGVSALCTPTALRPASLGTS